MITIPRDFPVQPLTPDQQAKDRCTCGTCGLSWDDGIVTSITPTPAARCPFEQFHEQETDDDLIDAQVRRVTTAIDAFLDYDGGDQETVMCEIVADLLHWADRHGIDGLEQIERALRFYKEETGKAGQ